MKYKGVNVFTNIKIAEPIDISHIEKVEERVREACKNMEGYESTQEVDRDEDAE